ncbi:MAG TPA: SEC-C metal-binding domain-containing protein [Bacillota bacterium]|nr:SEC-C metal-binding domain-containing protein [Bacillota bacterium]HPZ59070.1 SEC-C metal-binding domain-containing protein [Bacillota bacterium]HQC82049.1 SEC-C metal-binding domain-containing protein [Bacillota bacterium]
MLQAKADYLYTFEEWNSILSEEKRQESPRHTTDPRPLRRRKPDRNDPCPCGSGKKYKKCCGA